MRIFIAGASGALGRPLVRQLLADGHHVIGLTRSHGKAAALTKEGADAVVGDALTRDDVTRAVVESKPDAIVEILNALPKRGPMRPRDISGTNELRVRATRHLLDAAREAGVRRLIAESMIFGYGYGDVGGIVTEGNPFPAPAPAPAFKPALDAIGSLEDQVLTASRKGEIEGIVLRFGAFYGRGVGSTEFMAKMLRRRLLLLPGGGRGELSWIHVEDGAAAVRAALAGAEPSAVFNVVDDKPTSIGMFAAELARALDLPPPRSIPAWLGRLAGSYVAAVARTNVRVSNEKIKSELAWRPRYPTVKDGMPTVAADVG